MADFYDRDDVHFTIGSDEFNGVARHQNGVVRPVVFRSFDSFSQAAEENGQSRIYLGLHWSFDKVQGIRQGGRVADYVFENSSGRAAATTAENAAAAGTRSPSSRRRSILTAASSWPRRRAPVPLPTLDPAAEHDDRHTGGERPRRSGAGYGLDSSTRRRAVGRGEPRRPRAGSAPGFRLGRPVQGVLTDGRPRNARVPGESPSGPLRCPGFAPPSSCELLECVSKRMRIQSRLL